MKTIKSILIEAPTQLAKVSATPRLDVEVLLAAVLQRNRVFLFSEPEHQLTAEQQKKIVDFLARRQQGEPVAYITGEKEFWGLRLQVTADTLIPRPETEHLVEWILQHADAQSDIRVADLGTGSGAIALALASERKHWHVVATDQSPNALIVAKENATSLAIDTIEFYQGDWCEALPQAEQFHFIVSNPPYVAEDDPHLALLTHEPQSALVAQQTGLADIKKIAITAENHLLTAGCLIIEHGFNQVSAVQAILNEQGYCDIVTHSDLAQQPRFTSAQKGAAHD